MTRNRSDAFRLPPTSAAAPRDCAAKACRRRRGFSLVEVVVATLIVGVMMVAAMNTLGAFIRGQQRMAQQSRGWLLAQQLASEVLEQSYEEQIDAPTFGRESGEAFDRRTDYDDVDDYHGWDASPPQERDGTGMSELAQWRRTVSVDLVDVNNPDTTVVTDQGLKRIIIEVFSGDEGMARLVVLRSRSWLDPPFE